MGSNAKKKVQQYGKPEDEMLELKKLAEFEKQKKAKDEQKKKSQAHKPIIFEVDKRIIQQDY